MGNCDTCKFWETVDGRNKGHEGVCHRYPPTLSSRAVSLAEKDGMDATEAAELLWVYGQPKTCSLDWCGEHQPCP